MNHSRAERLAEPLDRASAGRTTCRSPGCGGRRSAARFSSTKSATSTSRVISDSGVPNGLPSSAGPSGSKSASRRRLSEGRRPRPPAPSSPRSAVRLMVDSSTRTLRHHLAGADADTMHLDVVGMAVPAVPVVDRSARRPTPPQDRRRVAAPPRRRRPGGTTTVRRSAPNRSSPNRRSPSHTTRWRCRAPRPMPAPRRRRRSTSVSPGARSSGTSP